MTSYDVTSGLADDVVLSYDANLKAASSTPPVDVNYNGKSPDVIYNSGDSGKDPDVKESAMTLSVGSLGFGGDGSSFGSRTLETKDVDAGREEYLNI